MAATPFNADARTAPITDDSHTIRAVSKVATFVIAVKPDIDAGLGNNSGNPLLKNLKCHSKNSFM